MNCLFLYLDLYFWVLYFRMEEIKWKKTSKSHKNILRKLGILKEYTLSQKRWIAPKIYLVFANKNFFFNVISWHLPTDKLLEWKFLSDRKPVSSWTTVKFLGQDTSNFSMQYKCNSSWREITLMVPSDYSVYLLQYHMLDKRQYPCIC